MNSEIERIRALIELDILDTEPEKMFDDITEIASTVCKMPIALISLLDINRQYFKSKVGLDLTETPIEQSFCKIAVTTPDDIFIVEDARLDIRFKDNPLVNEYPNIVSYYGVPLHSKARIAYGTLCVIDKKVKKLTKEQKDILIKLSKQIEYLIELRINNKLLNDYQAKIENYSKDMEEFAYLAAHDLKAPVRAIDSFIKLLDKKHEKLWDEKDKKYLSFIHQSSIKMNNLIQDLLEYSKSTMDIKKLEHIDLNELIVGIFNDLTPEIMERKPVLICNDMPVVFSSRIALTIIFNNLINNALKYQKEGQNPVVEIKLVDDYTHWIFTVKDKGIGIDSEYFEQIFKPFRRLHTNSEFQGNGLGLAACKKIVQNLNGQIMVDSVLDEGTIFTVKIPKK